MLNIDAIQNGIVIDHITAGTSMTLYNLLGLDKLDCSVAIIRNVRSNKSGKKDIIKIEDCPADLNLDMLAYLDPSITIVTIKDGAIVKKERPTLPKRLVNVVKCRNPRCITSVEEECDHIFELSENGKYRCIYCEQELHVKSN